MEARFAWHFGDVRIHTDQAAAESARMLGARAYSVGDHLVFSGGGYAPSTAAGLRLLAHELAHVTQRVSSPDGGPVVLRDEEPGASALPREEVDELDYAFVFTGGAYGRAAEAFIRRYYPHHRLIRGSSFEALFDQLYADAQRPAAGHRRHVREVVVVTHANAAGGLKIPLTRGDVARHRFFTIWDVDDLQEEFRDRQHQTFRQRRHEVVSTVMDDSTRIVIRGCEFGQAPEAMEVLRALFGGQPTVWAPTAYQGYETIRVGSSLLRTPEEAFDFLVQQDFLPPEMMPAPDEDKRHYIERVFGLHGTIPAEFFVVGPDARARLGALIAAGRGITEEAEPLKVREPVEHPSGGDYWRWASPGILGDDAELDRLTMRELAERAHTLMNPYQPEQACMVARLRRAWERKETSDSFWMDFLTSDTSDPLAGLPGETAPFLAYMANRFRNDPAANPYNGLAVENVFGDPNVIAIDAAQHPCATPHEDIFETQTLNYEITPEERNPDTGTFEEPPAVVEGDDTGPPLVGQGGSSPPRSGGGAATGSGLGRGSDASGAAAARARALDFSKSTPTPPPEPEPEPLIDPADAALAGLEGDALIQAILARLPPDMDSVSALSIADMIVTVASNVPLAVEIGASIAGTEIVLPAVIAVGADVLALIEPIIAMADLLSTLESASEAQRIGAQRLGLRLGLEAAATLARRGPVTAADLEQRIGNHPALLSQITYSYPLGPDRCRENFRIGLEAAASAANTATTGVDRILRRQLERAGGSQEDVARAYDAAVEELNFQVVLRVHRYLVGRMRSQGASP